MTTPEGAQLARYHQLVQVLAELARSSRGLETVVQTVHRQAATLFDAQVTLLALLDAPDEWIWELYEGRRHTSSRLPFYPDGILETVLLRGALSIPDLGAYLAEHPARLRRMLGAGEVALEVTAPDEDPGTVQSMLLVPLEVNGERVGVLSLQCYRTHAFGEADLLFLELLGQHVSIALENARLHSDLERVTLTDPLTELPNRRAFAARAGRALAELTAGAEPCTLVVADIRQFKHINDTCGHDAGDEVLIRVGRALQGALSPGDAAFRLGGDEFALLLRGGGADLRARVQRLSAALRETAWPPGVGPVCLNAGAAPGHPADALQDWFRRADRRMYRAKRDCAARQVPECGLDFGALACELLPGKGWARG